MRMTKNRFEHFFTLSGHQTKERTSRIRKPISAPQRLALTLRYLATGESQQSLSLSYRTMKVYFLDEQTSTVYFVFLCVFFSLNIRIHI